MPLDKYEASLHTVTDGENEPGIVKEALSGPNKDKWKEAMDEEIASLKENDTWEIVPKPKDRDVVSCKWVFKLKRKAEAKIDRHKAKLVTRVFFKKYVMDHDEVFAPVVRQTTFRTFLTLAGQKNMVEKHFDAKTAFLNGKLSGTMQQSEEYIVPGKKDYVCKLRKGIYGSKQAAKVWNDQLNNILKSYSFKQSEVDPYLYLKTDNEEATYLIVYVDDIPIC